MSFDINKEKQDYEILKANLKFAQYVISIMQAFALEEEIERIEHPSVRENDEWQNIKDIPIGQKIWDFERYKFRIKPKGAEK